MKNINHITFHPVHIIFYICCVFPVSGPLVDQSEMYGKHVVISSNIKVFFFGNVYMHIYVD